MSKKKLIIGLLLFLVAIYVIVFVIKASLFMDELEKAVKESHIDTVYEIEMQDGEVFVINAHACIFPDYELALTVLHDDKKIGGGQVDESITDGDSDKEFVESIVKEWHSGDIHIYECRWGMIYSKDNKKTFNCIMQVEYDQSKNYTELRDLMQ